MNSEQSKSKTEGNRADEKTCKYSYSYLGVTGAAIPGLSSIALAFSTPWFSWTRNALSDLGNPHLSGIAFLFNFCLILGGLLLVLYGLEYLKCRAKYTSYLVVVSAFSLQLVGAFDETYGATHFYVAALFFVTLIAASLTYTVEKKSLVGLATFVTSLSSWLLYLSRSVNVGIAVPEIVSSLSTVAWIVEDFLRSRAKTRATANRTAVAKAIIPVA